MKVLPQRGVIDLPSGGPLQSNQGFSAYLASLTIDYLRPTWFTHPKFHICSTNNFRTHLTYTGTILVSNSQYGWDLREQVSSGRSWTTVFCSLRHTLSAVIGQGPGPQTSYGTFSHWNAHKDMCTVERHDNHRNRQKTRTSVSGEYFLTVCFERLQTCWGHLSHSWLVV